MTESHNVELSHKLSEQESSSEEHEAWEKVVEIVEVIVLAIIAIATAWSGYQAAKWDGRQSVLYGTAVACCGLAADWRRSGMRQKNALSCKNYRTNSQPSTLR